MYLFLGVLLGILDSRIKSRYLYIASIWLSGFLPLSSFAAETNNPVAVRISSVPKIDGFIDDPVWSDIKPIDTFIQVQPHNGQPPIGRTEVLIGHDGRTLYIAIRAYENNAKQIIAQRMQRDVEGIEDDDHVTIVLDPGKSGRHGYIFTVNPNGAQRDGLVYDGVQKRYDWDAIWDAATQIDDKGWTAELAIPLSALGTTDGEFAWGLNIERWVAGRSERSRLFGYAADKTIYSLNDAGKLEGVKAEGPGIGLRVKPSLRFNSVNDGYSKDNKLEPGLEMFYRSKKGTAASLALNIDFGDAEADERIVNLTRFPLFFPEKREFFLQDAGRFSFGGILESPMPYFSRRIGLDKNGAALDLDLGLKLTGSVAGLEYGVLGAQVEKGEAENTPRMGVMRIAGSLNESTKLGMIATQGNPEGISGSSLTGVDIHHRQTQFLGEKTLDVSGWVQQSKNADMGKGNATGFNIDYPNIGLKAFATWQRIDEDFLPALGFVEESGVTRTNGDIGWWMRTEQGGDITPQIAWKTRKKLDGSESSLLFNPEFYMADAAGNYISPRYFEERDRLASPFELLPGITIPEGSYSWRYVGVEAGTSTARSFSAIAMLRSGEFYDGKRADQSLELTWNLNKHWGMKTTFERNDIKLSEGRYIVRTSSLRFDHAASSRLAESLLLQWDNVSNELGIAARLRWIIAPGRDLIFSLNRLHQTEDRTIPTQTTALIKLIWNNEW